jgi:epoxide hydrolase-like predicted phosphatase
MSIRAVIFDFGGVLMRTEDLFGRQKWETTFSLPPWGLARIVFESEVSVRAMRGEVPETEAWRHVAEAFGLNAAQLEEMQRDFWSGDHLDARLVAFLRDLRPRYKTAILSNAWGNARRLFEELGLDQVVDAMIISAEEGVLKPDARIYQIALERLGVRPAEAVFVDDFVENVAAARALGMAAVHFRDADQAMAEVEQYLEGRPA